MTQEAWDDAENAHQRQAILDVIAEYGRAIAANIAIY